MKYEVGEYEVEQKFRVDGFRDVEIRLSELGSAVDREIEQVDCYFAHPARDFRVTDEAFRLRRTGEKNLVTYKGPRIDTTTKTRKELELPLPDGEEYRRQFVAMLGELGFRPVAEVFKRRRKARVDYDGHRVEVSLDEVTDVGRYVELEILADEARLSQAKSILARLASQLGLVENERRSYLDLLLNK